MHEAVPGALLDRLERHAQIEAGPLGEHQRLAGGDEMDERQHVGDHLDHRRAAQRTGVQHRLADGGQELAVTLVERLVTADEHGDLAGRCLVHAPGDGRLQHGDAGIGGDRCQAEGLVAIGRAHVDPRAVSLGESGKDTVGARYDRVDRRWRRQAGEHHVRRCGHRSRAVRPCGTVADELVAERPVEVVHRERVSPPLDAGGEVAAEVAEPDEADTIAHAAASSLGTGFDKWPSVRSPPHADRPTWKDRPVPPGRQLHGR